jgi:2-dehydro-3-deoxyphosphogluconate aldolase / (4S)-4-hydroxy-2-oxoglutarate aldolase
VIFNREVFDALPIVGILRGFTPARVRTIVAVAADAGLRNLEVTMNSPAAPQVIREALKECGQRMQIGAGTVTNLEELSAARDAGATFVVTPVLCDDVVRACIAAAVPVFPGTMSLPEIMRAYALGVDMVKLFPANVLGPAYLAHLKDVLPQMRFMPTGGVTADSLPAWRNAGAYAVGIGSPLFPKADIDGERWTVLAQSIRRVVEAWRSDQQMSPERRPRRVD